MTDEELQKFIDDTEGIEEQPSESPEDSEQGEHKKTRSRVVNVLLILVLIACIGGIIAFTLSRRKPATDLSTAEAGSHAEAQPQKNGSGRGEITTVVTTAGTSEQSETPSDEFPTETAPVPESTTVSEDGEYFIYTIRLGDDFYSVLSNSGVTASDDNVFKLMEYNNMYDGIELRVGMEIKVPTSLPD